jgi:hypothetical protein
LTTALAQGNKIGYKEQSNAERAGMITKWKSWTCNYGAPAREERLRKAVSTAFLRLDRLDDSNPEVAHAKALLWCGFNDQKTDWP